MELTEEQRDEFRTYMNERLDLGWEVCPICGNNYKHTFHGPQHLFNALITGIPHLKTLPVLVMVCDYCSNARMFAWDMIFPPKSKEGI